MYVAHVAREARLPVLEPSGGVEVPVEGNQPPLYYLLAAMALRATGMGDLTVGIPPRNPASTREGGTEAAVYRHDEPGYPWVDVERATRTLRLLFLPVGALVVVGAYGGARLVRPEDRSIALLAGGFAATEPQFTFIMGSVTNDVLANGIAAAALLLMIRMIARGRAGRGEVIVLGVLAGLGLLAKMTLLFLIPAALFAFWLAQRARGRAGWRTLADGALFLAAAALVASPAFMRYLPTGDPFGLELNRRLFAERLHEPGLAYFIHTFAPALFFSLWGVFGHMNIHLGEAYWLFIGLTLATTLGLALRAWRGRVGEVERRAGALVAVALAVLLASIVTYNLSLAQPQGRYALPALLPLALLFATGLGELLGRRRRAAASVVAGLAAVNGAILLFVVVPAYGA